LIDVERWSCTRGVASTVPPTEPNLVGRDDPDALSEHAFEDIGLALGRAAFRG